ncbi:hypothetical protein [Flavivirga aquatica]|uniref:hypothetical protein n=1 Tax=Flavivirga aquatica TaxID=1849968 RepID=UPI00196AEB5F|nr:hypothetical protein [Flavivirga aquatica]
MNISDDEIQEQNQFEELIQGLINNKYGCCNDFLSHSTMAGLRSNMTTLNASGNMKSAGIGNKINFQKNQLIRNGMSIGLKNKAKINMKRFI